MPSLLIASPPAQDAVSHRAINRLPKAHSGCSVTSVRWSRSAVQTRTYKGALIEEFPDHPNPQPGKVL